MDESMKGMILAAGRGTRLRPLTSNRSKPMVLVANQPLISFPLRSLVNSGISDISIVAGDNQQELEQGLESFEAQARLTYSRQDRPLGLAHAVQSAYPTCHNTDFMLLFCDNLFAAPLAPAVEDWRKLSAEHSDLGALIHVLEVDDPRAFGVAELEGDWVRGLEEKPQQPKSNFAVVGIDIFKPVIYEAIPRIKPSARGELEITDAIQELINMGFRVYARRLEGFWYDTGTFADLINVLKPVIDLHDDFAGHGVAEGCSVDGPLGLELGARLTDCQVTGPVLAGPGVQATNCVLGPYVAIGAESQIADCRLSHAQIYPGSHQQGIAASEVLIDGDTVLSAMDSPFEEA